MKFLFFLLFSALSSSANATEILCPNSFHESVVADPALVFNRGRVLVMGTGETLAWNSLKAMINKKMPERLPLDLFHEIKVQDQTYIIPLTPEELPWDLQFYTFKNKKYLYGGVMTPKASYLNARWPEDNISRRIKVATYNKILKGWVFKYQPLFNAISHEAWQGHSYGQQIIRHRGVLYVLHEEISRDGVTEIFVRKLLTPFTTAAAKKILGIEHLSPAATRRLDGGQLLEGPRHQKIVKAGKEIHLIYFSTGDFPTKNYATRVAFSKKGIFGPYVVMSDKNGEAIDLTSAYKETKNLHGVGRAFPFIYKGKNWIIFHGAKDIAGVNHHHWPENLNNFQRCLFASPVNIRLGHKDDLSIQLSSK